MPNSYDTLILNPPKVNEGYEVNQLIASCPPLDRNSIYCNLLQTCHFRDTSMVAYLDGKLVGFVSGYLIPDRKDALFVWQVAVSDAARGKGIAKKMLLGLLKQPVCSHVNYIETTITQENEGSWALFRRLAKHLNSPLEESVFFDKTAHFNEEHDTEYLVRIGPF